MSESWSPITRTNPNDSLARRGSSDLQAVLNNVDGALIVLDPTGSILSWNRYPESFQHLVNRPLREGDSILSLIPAQWQAMAKGILQKVAKTHKSSTIDAFCTDSHGENLFFEVTCKSIAGKNNHTEQLLIEAKDVTSQKIFEKKLSSKATELSQLVEHANAVIISTDSRGCIIDWNEMSARIIGYGKTEAITRKFGDLVLEGMNLTTFETALNDVMEHRPLINHELKVRAKSGQQLTILINVNPKMNATGQVVGTLLIGQDITELVEHRITLESKLKSLTNELEDANRVIKDQKASIGELLKRGGWV